MMISRRILSLLTPIAIFFAGLAFSVPNATATPTDPPTLARVALLRSDNGGIELTFSAPDYALNTQTMRGVTYDTLTIPGADTLETYGYPQLPVIRASVGVPAEVALRVETIREQVTPFAAHLTLAPAPSPAPLTEDLRPGEWQTLADDNLYRSPMLFPATPLVIESEGWFRDQRIVTVAFYPFQYNPTDHTLVRRTSMDARLVFDGPAPETKETKSVNPFESVLARNLLNYAEARQWRASAGHARRAPQADLLGARVEVGVTEDGLYQVGYADLKAAGMQVDNINPHHIAVYSLGRSVAPLFAGDADEVFESGEFFVFYGEKFAGTHLAETYADTMANGANPANNWVWKCSGCDLVAPLAQYTDENVYSFVVENAVAPRMAAIDAAPREQHCVYLPLIIGSGSGTSTRENASSNPCATPRYYLETVHAEESLEFWSHEFTNSDSWFWADVRNNNATSYTTTLTAISAEVMTATLRADIASRAYSNGFPDHNTQFTLNGTEIVEEVWDGQGRHSFQVDIPQSLLAEGTNELQMTVLPNSNVIFPRMYFDFFEIQFARKFHALNGALAFTFAESGLGNNYTANGFATSDVYLLDITNPFSPTHLLNPSITGNATYSVTFASGPQTREAAYLLVESGRMRPPASIQTYAPPPFDTLDGADYLIITPQIFSDTVGRLASYRANQGHTPALIDIADLYRQFNFGIPHPVAIRNFLAYAFESWSTPPSYVVLVGDGHWNIKNNNPSKYDGGTIYMPPNMAWVDPWQGEVDATNLLATVVGDDTMPDLALGRLPVNSAEELDRVIDKIIRYEANAFDGWQNHHTFVADNTPDEAGDFVWYAEQIINEFITPDDHAVANRVFQNDFSCDSQADPGCAQVTHAITSSLNITGSLVLNYIGHGSLDRWSHERVLNTTHLDAFDNADQLTIMLSMTCLDGYWFWPNRLSLSAGMLTHAANGAVATFSPTGLGVASGHDLLHEGFYEALFHTPNLTMGAATLHSKMNLFQTNSHHDLMHTFTLFGDPALRIPAP